MYNLKTAVLLAVLAASGPGTALRAETTPGHNPANTVSIDPTHPDSFRNFAPELPATRARAAQVNTDFGLHVSEIEPGLYFLTDLIYQSAVLVTSEGVVVLDAPPSFGPGHRAAIEMAAPGVPITHLIMSHAHGDHNGGGAGFSEIDGLVVIAAQAHAESLAAAPVRGVPAPTQTFAETFDLVVGGVPIHLRTARFHAEDADTIIHLPRQRFLMAVDTITPGEAPFMNFGATSNVRAYLEGFDTFLDFDFEHFLSGHVSVLGTREDVVKMRDYTRDVWDSVHALMPGFNARMDEALQLVEFRNGNLAYRMAMESLRDDCAAGIIGRWKDELSVVDLWADSHCETVLLYAIMH